MPIGLVGIHGATQGEDRLWPEMFGAFKDAMGDMLASVMRNVGPGLCMNGRVLCAKMAQKANFWR